LLLAYLHFPLSNGYLIVEVLDYSVLPCFILDNYSKFVFLQAVKKLTADVDIKYLRDDLFFSFGMPEIIV